MKEFFIISAPLFLTALMLATFKKRKKEQFVYEHRRIRIASTVYPDKQFNHNQRYAIGILHQGDIKKFNQYTEKDMSDEDINEVLMHVKPEEIKNFY